MGLVVKSSEYTYVFGFPAWFYSCIVGFIVMVILLSLVVRFVFQDISLDEEEKVRNNR